MIRNTVVYIIAMSILLGLGVLFTTDYIQACTGQPTLSLFCRHCYAQLLNQPLLLLVTGVVLGFILGLIVGFILGHLFW